MHEIDLERVICALSELPDHGCRGFSLGEGPWPLRGLVVRTAKGAAAYVNRCPHAGHPLNLKPHRFLTPDNALILCSSHGALFEKEQGYCVAGPCAGQSLTTIPIVLENGYVLLADGVDSQALADQLA
jgi:nitrite reductase/ring-hydroxylating ferredoxin subunit